MVDQEKKSQLEKEFAADFSSDRFPDLVDLYIEEGNYVQARKVICKYFRRTCVWISTRDALYVFRVCGYLEIGDTAFGLSLQCTNCAFPAHTDLLLWRMRLE